MTGESQIEPEETSAEAKRKASWSYSYRLWRRFARWLAPDRSLGLTVLLLLVVAVPAGVVSPELVRRVFDDALPKKDVEQLLRLGLGIVAITLVAHLLRLVAAQLGATLKSRVRQRIAGELFSHVMRLPLSYFSQNETGYIMGRIRDDVRALDALMTDTLAQSAVDAGRAVLFFSLLLFTDRGLALSGLSMFALVVIGVLLFNPALRARSRKAQESEAELNAALHQALTGIFTVRESAQETTEDRRFGTYLSKAVAAFLSRDRMHVMISYVIGLALALGTYVILTIGAFRILRGTATVGTLFQFSIYLTYVMGAVTSLIGMNPAIQHAIVSLERIFKILDDPTESQPKEPVAIPPGGLRGRIEFDHVSFAYDSDKEALIDISLKIEPGESVALVGRSGAGKTTFVHLVPRLRDPTRGVVRIDGVDVRDYDLTAMRSQIGFVPQDVFLFHRSIRENIAYGRPDATDAEIRAAVVAAHVDVFTDALPKGLDTLVGERGVKLSGGERQRVAIAREILRDPPILILDEATSSLDSHSEQLIRDAIEKLKRNRTCILIAHRLSTVVGADRIVVLDQGRIVESGSHHGLVAKNGAYAQLVAAARLLD